MLRVMICWIPLLCGCSTPAVRCDAHLLPINPPAPGIATSSAATSSAAASSAARRAP